MICGQSLQAFAFLLANASQAGSVDTGLASGVENLLATSFVTGVDGTESEISTVTDVGRVFDFFRCSLLSSLDTAVSIFFSPS